MFRKKISYILSFTILSSLLINFSLQAMEENSEKSSLTKSIVIKSPEKSKANFEQLTEAQKRLPLSIDFFSANDDEEDDWVMVTLTPEGKLLQNMDPDDASTMSNSQKKAWEKAGDWCLYPGASGYRAQFLWRNALKGGYALWIIAEPLILPAATRLSVDFVLGQYGPLILEYAADSAETLASTVTSPLVKLDPTGLFRQFSRYSIRNVAKGEALRKLVLYAEYMEKYTIPTLTSFSRLAVYLESPFFKANREDKADKNNTQNGSASSFLSERSEVDSEAGWVWIPDEKEHTLNSHNQLLRSIGPAGQSEFITEQSEQSE